jgi:hypothetical protein
MFDTLIDRVKTGSDRKTTEEDFFFCEAYGQEVNGAQALMKQWLLD